MIKLPLLKIENEKSKVTIEKVTANFSDEKYQQPALSLGFTTDIHEMKDTLWRKISARNKIMKKSSSDYHVKNPFEHKINSPGAMSMDEYAKKYFSLDKKPPLLSRAFFKMWEMIVDFDLVHKKDNFISAHLAEGPGSFIQATLLFREMNTKKHESDLHYGITLHSESTSVPAIDTQFINFYSKKYKHHKTYSLSDIKISKDTTKDNGDITQVRTIKSFEKNFSKNKADLVTADGGFNWKDENLQEQEATRLILGEIICAMRIQKEGGHFVCKIFETYTFTMVKMILFCKQFYKNVTVTKPLTSRWSNSEKYIVCTGFLGIEEKMIEKLYSILETKGNIIDFLNIAVPQIVVNGFRKFNSELSTIQLTQIANMIKYISASTELNIDNDSLLKKDIEEQIKANDSWIKKYFK